MIDDIKPNNELIEGIDYTLSPLGYRIMTDKFLRQRGYCCGNGCINCPYHPKATKGNTILKER